MKPPEEHIRTRMTEIDLGYDTPCWVANRAMMTHCKHGHEFTEENTIRSPRQRRCRACTGPKRKEHAQ